MVLRQKIILGGKIDFDNSKKLFYIYLDVLYFRNIQLFDQCIIYYHHRKVGILKRKIECVNGYLGELAPAILVTIQTASKLIDVIIVHMGNDRDDLDRKLQAEKLRDIMQNRFDWFFFEN